MHSLGTYAQWQSYSDPEVDELVEEGVMETDDNKRIEIYWKLGNKYFEDAPSVPLVQATGRHWERTWVAGWYYNPIYPGDYYYHLWKEWYTPPAPPATITTSNVLGSSIPITAKFIDPTTGNPAAGFLVFIQQSTDQETWTNVGAAITDQNGEINVLVVPPSGIVYYRANFTGYMVPEAANYTHIVGNVLLNAEYYEDLIENRELPFVLLSEIGATLEVETKSLGEILAETLSEATAPLATKEEINAISEEMESLGSTVSAMSTMMYASIGIAVLAIIIAIVAVVKK